jgi:hypothetical protein
MRKSADRYGELRARLVSPRSCKGPCGSAGSSGRSRRASTAWRVASGGVLEGDVDSDYAQLDEHGRYVVKFGSTSAMGADRGRRRGSA